MKVFINDLSIIGQASNEKDAMDILTNLATVVIRSKCISFKNTAYRTKTLADRVITGTSTVKDVLISSSTKRSAVDERQRKLALEVFLKQPFVTDYHIKTKDSIVDNVGNCLKGSCFDEASTTVGLPLAVSAKNCPNYLSSSILIHSSISGTKTVLNVIDENCLAGVFWKFEQNRKHKIQEYRAAGEIVSEMNLSNSDAQLALNNGIKVNSRVYSYFNNEWYQFHCHHDNLYHGFRIELEKNNPDHMRALAISNSLNNTPYGQIFL